MVLKDRPPLLDQERDSLGGGSFMGGAGRLRLREWQAESRQTRSDQQPSSGALTAMTARTAAVVSLTHGVY